MNESGTKSVPAQSSGSDEVFHFLAYPAHILVWVSDAEGMCTFVSPSWAAYTGRAPSKELGKGWLDLVHEDDRQVLVHGLDEAGRNRHAYRLIFRYLREDGVYRWFVAQGMPQSSPTSAFVGHLCLCFDVTLYQEGEAEMESSVQSVFPLLKQTRLIAVILDRHGRINYSNGGLSRVLKYSGTELANCKLFERHLAASDRGLLERLYPGGTQSMIFPSEFQSELLTRDHQSRLISWHAVTWREFSGWAKGTILIGDDVTAVPREEEQTSLYLKAFEATDHAIVVTDAAGTMVSVNQAFTHLTGYRREEALGNNPRMLQSGRHDEAFYRKLWEILLATGHWHGDIWDRNKSGDIYSKYLSISLIKNARGETTHYTGIFFDNSERKTLEERLEQLAHYDTLTGAPNRCLLLDRVEQALERARRLGAKVALLYLDLDHFKAVNDTLGHGAGDELLRSAVQRMKICVRGADTVARLGGDEFVVLVPDNVGVDDAGIVARKLLEALKPPYDIEGQFVACTPSIGIALYPDDADNWKTLMKNADAAMYQAKQSGRANFKFFHEIDFPHPDAG